MSPLPSRWCSLRRPACRSTRLWHPRHPLHRPSPARRAPQYDRRPPSRGAVFTRAQSHEPAVHPLRRLLCQFPCLVLLGGDGYPPPGHRACRAHRPPDLSSRGHARHGTARATLRRAGRRDWCLRGLSDLCATPLAVSGVRGRRTPLQRCPGQTWSARARTPRSGLRARGRRLRHRAADPACAYAVAGASIETTRRRMLEALARLSGAGTHPGEDRMDCLRAHADVQIGALPCTARAASHRHRASTVPRVGSRSASSGADPTSPWFAIPFFDVPLSLQNPLRIQRLAAPGCGAATRGSSFATDRSELWHHCGNQTRIGTVLVRPGTCAEGLKRVLRFFCSTARC